MFPSSSCLWHYYHCEAVVIIVKRSLADKQRDRQRWAPFTFFCSSSACLTGFLLWCWCWCLLPSAPSSIAGWMPDTLSLPCSVPTPQYPQPNNPWGEGKSQIFHMWYPTSFPGCQYGYTTSPKNDHIRYLPKDSGALAEKRSTIVLLLQSQPRGNGPRDWLERLGPKGRWSLNHGG